eukprot:scaffold19.g1795.t1
MRPVIGVVLTTLLGFLQLAVVCVISGVVAQLDGTFSVHRLDLLTTCALSMGAASACVYSYISTAIGIVLSLCLVGMVCATQVEGSRGMGFCGPIVSFLGFLYFTIYASIVTVSASKAEQLSSEGHGLRQATIGLGWSAAGLYALTFFLSAATAKSTPKDGPRHGLARTLTRAKYRQPLISPATSPKKAWIPMETESPKKWHQPPNSRSKFVVTSNGVRTLVVVAGTPTALSRQTTLGSYAGSAVGSLPGSPTKGLALPHALASHADELTALPVSAGAVAAAAALHPAAVFGQAHQTHHHAGGRAPECLPHSTSTQVFRSASGLPGAPLLRGQSEPSHNALWRGASGSHGGTPRDPTARVYFDTTRAKITLGLMFGSGGGLLAARLLDFFEGQPDKQQMVTLGLIFWRCRCCGTAAQCVMYLTPWAGIVGFTLMGLGLGFGVAFMIRTQDAIADITSDIEAAFGVISYFKSPSPRSRCGKLWWVRPAGFLTATVPLLFSLGLLIVWLAVGVAGDAATLVVTFALRTVAQATLAAWNSIQSVYANNTLTFAAVDAIMAEVTKAVASGVTLSDRASRTVAERLISLQQFEANVTSFVKQSLSLIFLGALFMCMRLPVSAARVVRAMRRHRFERELEAAQRGAAPKQGAGGALDGLSKRELSLATEGSGHIKAAQAQADAEAEVERGLALPSAA